MGRRRQTQSGGFDGVGHRKWLPDRPFLHSSSNKHRRIRRFGLCRRAGVRTADRSIGADRVGVRLSPFGAFNGAVTHGLFRTAIGLAPLGQRTRDQRRGRRQRDAIVRRSTRSSPRHRRGSLSPSAVADSAEGTAPGGRSGPFGHTLPTPTSSSAPDRTAWRQSGARPSPRAKWAMQTIAADQAVEIKCFMNHGPDTKGRAEALMFQQVRTGGFAGSMLAKLCAPLADAGGHRIARQETIKIGESSPSRDQQASSGCPRAQVRMKITRSTRPAPQRNLRERSTGRCLHRKERRRRRTVPQARRVRQRGRHQASSSGEPDGPIANECRPSRTPAPKMTVPVTPWVYNAADDRVVAPVASSSRASPGSADDRGRRIRAIRPERRQGSLEIWRACTGSSPAGRRHRRKCCVGGRRPMLV